jgi:hypothetical protein
METISHIIIPLSVMKECSSVVGGYLLHFECSFFLQKCNSPQLFIIIFTKIDKEPCYRAQPHPIKKKRERERTGCQIVQLFQKKNI